MRNFPGRELLCVQVFLLMVVIDQICSCLRSLKAMMYLNVPTLNALARGPERDIWLLGEALRRTAGRAGAQECVGRVHCLRI